MTKAELLQYLDILDCDDEIDLNELQMEIELDRAAYIEELEERQHQSGFYEFQDLMEMRRRER